MRKRPRYPLGTVLRVYLAYWRRDIPALHRFAFHRHEDVRTLAAMFLVKLGEPPPPHLM